MSDERTAALRNLVAVGELILPFSGAERNRRFLDALARAKSALAAASQPAVEVTAEAESLIRGKGKLLRVTTDDRGALQLDMLDVAASTGDDDA